MPECSQCNTSFVAVGPNAARQQFCSKKCCSLAWSQKVVWSGDCTECGRPAEVSQATLAWRKRKRLPLTTCTSCMTSASSNPNWKGGHHHWSPGRYGKDKDGLSWKVQRKLAWERDAYTCQHCGEKKQRNPDVHHLTPYRISQSHALSNLLCLCKKCHLTEEAKVQDQWGGQLIERTPSQPRLQRPKTLGEYPACPVCGDTLTPCGRGKVKGSTRVACSCTKQEARALRSKGHSVSEIARHVGMSERTLFYWFRA